MKTILVPTDFSKTARNAASYAAEIAKEAKAKLVLFHVYTIPVIPAEAPVIMPIKEIEEDAMSALKKTEKNLRAAYGAQITIESACQLGFPVEEISRFAEKCNADLIVMGMEGAGPLMEKLMGSVTTALIKKAECPVLVVGRKLKFSGFRKIVFAADYNQVSNRSVFTPLKEFAALFNSHIYILNVVPLNEKISTISKAVEGMKLDHLLEGINHSFHFRTNNDVIEGINQFVDEEKMELVVMIPHAHSVFQNMFREPDTKRMAFHAKAALLALHE